MIADEDGWTGGAEYVVRVLNDEADTREELRRVVEGACSGPLGNVLLADESENDGGDDAVDGAAEEAEVHGERAGVERRLGDDKRQHEESRCQGAVCDEECDGVI